MKKSKLYPYLLVGPAIGFMLVFVVYPMFYLGYISLTNWNLINPTKKFVGFKNYIQLFQREEFYKTLFNTLTYTFWTVALIMIFALLLAVWFNKNTRFDIFGQLAIFTPHIIALVSVAMVWLWLMDPGAGFLNYLLELLGLPPSQWLQSSKTSMMSIIIVSVWKSVGYYTLIILAALQGIPKEIYEAAALDNTPKAKTFFRITLPMISPQLFFLLIVMTIGSFKVFETVRVMTNGGPNYSTNVLVYFIYDNAFMNMKLGYASAAGMVLLFIVGIVTVVYFKMLSKKVHYQ